MAETPGSKKKRLKDEAKAAKATRAPKNKSAKPAVFTGHIETPVKPKKESSPAPQVTPEDLQEKPTAAKFKETEEPGTNERNIAFVKQQKEKDVSEIGEATHKYDKQLDELPFSDTPREKVTATPDPLRPRVVPKVVAPTPAEEARRTDSGRLPAGTGRGKASPFTFNVAAGVPAAPTRDAAKLLAEREAQGFEGLPGEETGSHELAKALFKKDRTKAEETGKSVHGVSADDEDPTSVTIHYSHHRKLADVILTGGVNEEQIKKAAAGTGATFESKVSYLWHTLRANKASAPSLVDHKEEGVTHWVHPTTGVAHAISDNHPDMPKMVNPDTSEVTPAFQRAGTYKYPGTNVGVPETRVRRDVNTHAWVLDRKTGNAEVDQDIPHDHEKPLGWNVINLRGTKAYKLNPATPGSRSLWHHEINNMKGEFPQSVSQDSRIEHKHIGDKLMLAMARKSPKTLDSGPDAATRAHNGRAIGITSTGRTKPRGIAVDPSGDASPASAPVTSRGRVARPGALTPTAQFGDDGYNHGGSVRVTGTTQAQEFSEVRVPDAIEHLSRDRLARKNADRETRSANINNEGALTSAPRGSAKVGPRELLVEKRHVLPASKESGTKLTTGMVTDEKTGEEILGVVSRQFNSVSLPETPAPRWATPNIIGNEEPGVSSAQPIKYGRPSAKIPGYPEYIAAKSKSKFIGPRAPGLTDQELPDMQFAGEDNKKPEENPIIQLEGPLTKLQTKAAPSHANSSSATLREYAGKLITSKRSLDKLTKVAPAQPKMSSSTQLAKIPGNNPIAGEPSPTPSTPKVAKKVKAPRNKWAIDRGLTDTRTPKPEQAAFPGMEDVGSFHATGQQWIKNTDLSQRTGTLQRKAKSAGVPGGTNPVQVKRGTEAKKSSGSFKNKK